MGERKDASSNANYNAFVTTHTSLRVTLDFAAKLLRGTCQHTLTCMDASAKEIILDSSFLNVTSVSLNDAPVKFKVAPRKEPLGSPLHISLPNSLEQGASCNVSIEYSTTDRCTALQWLEPAQTAGDKPYLFSQCQAIHARSMYPCQDTPLIKATFTFSLRSPYPVVATGLPKGASKFENGTLLYDFEQPVPIPTYLAAIASGDLASAQIGSRSVLYTEPKYIYAAQREMLPVVDKFIKAAESILPPYAWHVYNVLIAPASYPYGGMENAALTFATPTILAGDGSNLDVIAHELAHSWSGNSVTCAGWAHFWCNEGWTVFLERKIVGILHGRAAAEFSAIVGWKALEDSVAGYGEKHEFTKLIPDLTGVDPDDSFSSIPYEKGFNLLYYLEHLLGEGPFAKYTRWYFEHFAGQSITSFQFKQSLYDFFGKEEAQIKKLDGVDWNHKFYSPGLPTKPDFDTSLAVPCYNLAKRWINAQGKHKDGQSAGFAASDVDSLSAGQRVVFLETLESSHFRDPDLVASLGDLYGFIETQNAEVAFRYYLLAVTCKQKNLYHAAADWVGTVGRMKFVRPLFRALNKADTTLARETFGKVAPGLHPICKEMVRKDLKL
ncbi:peptidase family M1-domain-containing protein [Protomyces lactucae-debilis]|uniref:Peptidase family M1-domain-containing protein n=1 Tax=Protomyces lactucae-debilis TaxID=2754530 RepID=A0A1Y2FC66_PROLT|nr:peptidase family M1-domain-containing protein [Protomyces lactucae-debilis]ORY81519.1 peptidase family M1-domain-containing protein [Protomyces lactucae-debilis]